MIIKKLHQVLFVLFLSLSSTLFCQELEKGAGVNVALNTENVDQQKELQKELESEMAKKNVEDEGVADTSLDSVINNAQNPAKMLEKLPKDSQQVVLRAVEACQDFVAIMQHPIVFMLDILQNLGNKIEISLAQDGEKNKNLLANINKSLQKIQGILTSRDMQIFVFMGTKSSKIEKEFKEISEELALNFNELQNSNIPEKNYFKENFQILKDSIVALSYSDGDLLAKSREKYAKEFSIKAFHFLDSAINELNKLKKGETAKDSELSQAINFWQKVLKNFDELRPSKLTKLVNFAGGVVPFIEGGYFFYSKFMELYRIDNPIVWSSPLSLLGALGDQAFRFAMIPIYFLKHLSQISKSGVNPKMAQVAWIKVITDCLQIYIDPNFCVRNFSWPVRAFYRIAPVIAYKGFHEFNSENSKKSGFWTELDEIYSKLSEDEKFRRAIWFSMKDGYQSFASAVEMQIKKRISADSLKKVEDMSLGLIKPDLLRFILDTTVPVVTYNHFPKCFAEITKQDVMSREFNKISDYSAKIFGDWYYVGEENFQDDEYFIEGRILGYLATNIGASLGKEITRLNRRPIKFVMSKVVKGCSVVLEKLGFIEKSDWQEQLLKDIRENVYDLMTTDPSMRIMVQQALFPMLVGLGIMSQLEAAKLEDEFNSGEIDEKKIEFLVDKIYSSITDTVIIGVGGFIGSFVAWKSADYLMKKHGPFWPKIKNGCSQIWNSGGGKLKESIV